MGADKLRQRLIEVAEPFLREGERPEVASIATVGPSSHITKSVLASVAGAVISGGMGAVYITPVKQYVLLTSERLLLFAQNQMTGRPLAKLNAEAPRAALSASPVKKGLLTAAFELTVAGEPKAVKLTFPLPARDDAVQISAALGAQ